MKSTKEIDKLTESTLNSLDGLQQIEVHDFLHSKIMNRMRMREQQERLGYRRLMLRLSFALVLFTGLNVGSFYVLQHHESHLAKPVKSSAAAFAEEYSLNGESYNY